MNNRREKTDAENASDLLSGTPKETPLTPRKTHKSNKRKWKHSAAANTVSPDAVSSELMFKVKPKITFNTFKLIKNVHTCVDCWFSTKDWCSLILNFNTHLKGYEDEITTQRLTLALNKDANFGGDLAMHNYFDGNKYIIYSNYYGLNRQDNQYYYLVTNNHDAIYWRKTWYDH